MAAVKADGLLYFSRSHLSCLFQLTTSNQTSYRVQEGIKVSGAGGRQGGEKARQNRRTTDWQCCQPGLGPWFLVTAKQPQSLVFMEIEKKWRLCFLPVLTPLCFAH